MICPNCGTLNGAGAKFCQECATPLATTCPNCGAAANPGAKFCQECATPLTSTAADTVAAGTPAAPATAVASGAERKLVTVLFADLVGFTPFAEDRDAEDVRDTLNRYFDLASEVIKRYGGTVEKFIGDAVMAVWGAPTAHEDDAERAVRAGMELVDSVTSLGEGIQARAGVLTGEAAVRIGATNQGMVAGDLVNTASRLQSVAPPGTVLVGESTHRAAAAAIAFEEAGEQVLKGKQAPIAAWRAVRILSERGGRNRSEALEAPFVGRREELRLLKDLFHATGREKRLRVVSVIGPAGIGKSRLAWEFLKYVDGMVEDIYWHSGRSPAYGEGISFWALGEMVRERCGLAEQDDEETTRAKVREQVERWVTDADDREWIERALLTLLGVESGMAADQLFGAWRTFFERIAEHGPVVLLFEDMHFADAGLLDFIDHLLDWSRALPIYVVTLARPELLEKRQDWGAGKRSFVSMYVEPLGEADMRELLAGLVPGLPESAVAAIVARADGIPLYAVETVRTLLANGRLIEQDGVYVPQGDLTSLAVPETLTALIAARLDALDETDRRIVHDAAVLGQSFAPGALAAILELPEAELEPRLAGLVRRELFGRQMDPRSPERGQYAFVQALIREVAYNTLSKKDRKKLHLAAARHFESLGSDELAGALASHYLAAHANAGEDAEAEALAGQARIALRAATTRATDLGAFSQAISFLDQALKVTPDDGEQADLLIQSGAAARTLGRTADSEERLRRAQDLASRTGDTTLMACTAADLGAALNQEYRAADAREILEAALADLEGVHEREVAKLRLQLARTLYLLGERAKAHEVIEEMLSVAELRDFPELVAPGLMIKANVMWAAGRRREAFAVSEGARGLAEEQGLTDLVLMTMTNLIGGHAEFDLSRALDGYAEIMALARRTGRRGWFINGVANLGYAGFKAGIWDDALREIDALLAEELSDRDRMVLLNNASIIRASRGEDVDSDLAEIEKLATGMTAQWHGFLADPLATLQMARGQFKEAVAEYTLIADEQPGSSAEYLQRAARAALWAGDVQTASALQARLQEVGGYGVMSDARRQTLAAGIAAAEGRVADALPLFDVALRNWRASNSRWDEAMAGMDMALLLDPADRKVADVIESTRAILERLGAKPYLEMLDAAAARAERSAPPARRTSDVAVGS